MSTRSRAARQCRGARRGRLLRSPRAREPLAEDEARRDPPDRRRPAAPLPGVGRRGRPPGPVAARRDRGGGDREQRARRCARSSRRSSGSWSRLPTSSCSTSRPAGWSRRDGQCTFPPRKYPRTARVNEVMLEVLAEELERMSDPRLELVTLTGVDVYARSRVRQGVLLDAGRGGRPRGRGRRRRRARAARPRRLISGGWSAASCAFARSRN